MKVVEFYILFQSVHENSLILKFEMLTRRADYAHHSTTSPPEFSDLATALQWYVRDQFEFQPWLCFCQNINFRGSIKTFTKWSLNPNWHEGRYFYLLYNYTHSIFLSILIRLPSGVMDKAVDSGSVGPWFDPCLRHIFFNFLKFFFIYLHIL